MNLEKFVFNKTDKEKNVSVRVYMEIPKTDNDVSDRIRKSLLALINEEGDYSRDSIWMDMETPQFIQFGDFSNMYMAGAAHGIYGFGYYIFDLETGKQLDEDDIFTDRDQITKLLRTEGLARFMKEEGGDGEMEDISKEAILADGNFRISGDELMYQFNPYEIGSYALGALTFYLKKESVKPYMKPGTSIYRYWFGEK